MIFSIYKCIYDGLKYLIITGDFCLISLFFIVPFLTQSQDAKDIVIKADNKIRGKSSYSEMSISIVRPKWQKTMEMKNKRKKRTQKHNRTPPTCV